MSSPFAVGRNSRQPAKPAISDAACVNSSAPLPLGSCGASDPHCGIELFGVCVVPAVRQAGL